MDEANLATLADPSPLRVERDDAWAELQRSPEGVAVLEMRDATHHHCGLAVDSGTVLAAGSEWWFLAGPLPEGASSVEVNAAGERYSEGSHAGCWLVAVPRDVFIAGIEIVALDSRVLPVNPFSNVSATSATGIVPQPSLRPDWRISASSPPLSSYTT